MIVSNLIVQINMQRSFFSAYIALLAMAEFNDEIDRLSRKK